MDWSEELHPRDPTGKFAGAGATGVARELERERRAVDVEQLSRYRQLGEKRFERLWPEGKTKEERAESFVRLREARARVQAEETLDSEGRLRVPAGRKWIDHVEGLPEQTWQAHWEKGDDGKPLHPDVGRPTPERVAEVHNKVYKKAFENAKPTPEGAKRRAILTMGAPASGKSSVVGDMVNADWVKVDPDWVKEQLPEYKTALAASAKDAAKMAHEESSYVAKQIRDRALAEGYPVMIDGTGRNPDTYSNLIDKLHKNGYEVTLVMADLDEETGHARMEKRAEATGRYVPPRFVTDAYRNIPGNFEKFAHKADSFKLVDTRGVVPKVVWRKSIDRGEEILDEDRVAEFKSRAHTQRWKREEMSALLK